MNSVGRAFQRRGENIRILPFFKKLEGAVTFGGLWGGTYKITINTTGVLFRAGVVSEGNSRKSAFHYEERK